jgi:hypothetical protein
MQLCQFELHNDLFFHCRSSWVEFKIVEELGLNISPYTVHHLVRTGLGLLITEHWI